MTYSQNSHPLTLLEWFSTTAPPSHGIPSILLLDGGVSTHLEHLIAPQTFSHRELWSSSLLLTQEGREYIKQGHADWLLAGSDILTTVTYQCHFGLVGTGSNNDDESDIGTIVSKETMSKMIRQGIEIARDAIYQQVASTKSSITRSVGPFVVASTGPYGAAMADGSEYSGNYPLNVTEQALLQFHRQKAAGLWDCHPDGIAVETIPNLLEVGVVCQVLQELKQRKKHQYPCCCWISLACQDGTRLNDGSLLKDALDIIQSMDSNNEFITAIGVNCCDSVHIAPLVKTIAQHIFSCCKRDVAPRGIVVYPNSGESWDAANEEWKEGTGADNAQFADRLIEVVSIIHETWKKRRLEFEGPICAPKILLGGCCRTSQRTIATLRNRIDAMQDQFLVKE
ncbi:homocysteine S-methyltransferase [Nitzschia inconspicua]|uniref:Homocysteine S-methyltransferase n=1 Tax=Nitzschia inconspicua TaxID=303405 RepID=A0A9K3PWX7_9STRA|nr:homocysteine S-methyltransferase [Nitzschia inconspicua]